MKLLFTIFFIISTGIISFSQEKFSKLSTQKIIEIGEKYKNQNLLTELSYYQKAYQQAEPNKETNLLAILEEKIGRNLGLVGRGSEAIVFLEKAKNRYLQDNKPLALGNIYLDIVLHYRLLGRYPLALEYGYKALSLFENLKNEEAIARANVAIADILYFQKAYDEANKLIKKAFNYQIQLSPPSSEIVLTYKTRGDIELAFGHHQQALAYQKEGLKIARSLNDSLLITRLLNGVGNALKYLYNEKEGFASYQEGLEIANKLNAVVFQYSHLVNITGYYEETGQTRQVRDISLKVIKQLKSANSYYNLTDLYATLAYCYKTLGMADSVYFYMEKKEAVNDSLLSVETKELQTKYQAEQKEAKINQQTTELRAQNQKFWITVAILLCAMATGAFLYKLTRQLRLRNQEKEYLIKEIHHRVKNNLTVIGSLLELQASDMDSGTAKSAILEGQNRVKSIAMIHHRLYQNENFTSIELQEFAHELFKEVGSVFKKNNIFVRLENKIPKVYLDIDTAIPLGLILNELYTNSFKYAFLEEKENTILLFLEETDKGNFQFIYQDTGPGLPVGFDFKKSKSLGIRLINRLAKQLSGEAIYQKLEHTAQFIITFKDSQLRSKE